MNRGLTGQRGQQILMVAVFVAVIVALGCLFFILPARDTSALENRDLAQQPAWPSSFATLPTYLRSWDAYVSDQMPFRDSWVKAFYWLQINPLGRSRLGEIAFGSDGYLLRVKTNPAKSAAGVRRLVEPAADLAAKLQETMSAYGGHLVIVNVPEKSSFERRRLPGGIVYPALRDTAEKDFLAALAKRHVDAMDLRPTFERNRKVQLYYKTDHHWTFPAVFLTYTAIMDHLGLPALTFDRLRFKELPNPFVGSENKMIGYVFHTDDRFSIGENPNAAPFSMSIDRVMRPAGSSYYQLPKTQKESTGYGRVYRWANSGEVVVNTHRPELPDVLLLGDSFKAPLQPLLYDSFNITRQIDLRAFKTMPLLTYVAKYKPDYLVYVLSGPKWVQYPWNAYDETIKSDVSMQD